MNALLPLLTLLAVLPEGGPAPAEPVVTAVPHVRAVPTTDPMTVDGKLSEPAWAKALKLEDFRQFMPFGGAAPTEATEVRVLFDREAVYFGFTCYHRHTPIVSRLTRRDTDSETEWASLEIDSRREGKVSFMFALNVAGVLADGVIHDGFQQSLEWDENWEGRTARIPDGWTAELRIPFRVLRFSPHEGGLSLGFRLSRFIANPQERVDWPLIPREIASPIPLYAVLEGLEDIRPGGRWELRPFVLGQLRYDSDPSTRQQGLYPSAAAGLDLKLHLNDSLTLDVATLPDFAQVEADQVVLNLNNYEVLYPEKRPLFLEGAEAFSTQLQLFYSRRIGSISETPVLRPSTSTLQETLVRQPSAPPIYAAAKLAGRLGESWNVVAQTAFVARSGVEVAIEDPSSSSGVKTESRTLAPRSLMSVLRLRRESDNQSHLGLLATAANRFQESGDTSPCPQVFAQTGAVVVGRCFHDAYAGGLDGLWRSREGTYSVAGQLAATWLHGGRDALQPDGNVIQAGAVAPAFWTKLAKDGGPHWVGSLAYSFLGKDVDFNDLGYMQRQNLSNAHAIVEYRTLDPGTYTLETHTRLELDSRFNLDGVSLGQNAQLGWRSRLKRYTWLSASLIGGPARYDDREVGALDGFRRYAFERAAYLGLRTEIITDLRSPFVATVGGEATTIGGGAHVLKGKASFFLHAFSQLELELDPELTWEAGEPRLAWASGAQTDTQLSFGRLDARSASLTLRASYAFLPRLTLQTYAQAFLASGHYTDFFTYDRSVEDGRRIRLADLRAAPTLANADFQQAALNLNVVLRWEWLLGSTLFLVYTRAQTPSVTLAPGAHAELDLGPLRRGGAVDVLLLKLTYWWAR